VLIIPGPEVVLVDFAHHEVRSVPQHIADQGAERRELPGRDELVRRRRAGFLHDLPEAEGELLLLGVVVPHAQFVNGDPIPRVDLGVVGDHLLRQLLEVDVLADIFGSRAAEIRDPAHMLQRHDPAGMQAVDLGRARGEMVGHPDCLGPGRPVEAEVDILGDHRRKQPGLLAGGFQPRGDTIQPRRAGRPFHAGLEGLRGIGGERTLA